VKLNVIVPSYNESPNVPYFYGRARQTLDSIDGLEWSLVYINNSSDDDTLDQIMKLRAADDRVKVITLSRNFGYHAALVAGLSSVDGDYYAIVDVDCEDPPELLADFYAAIQKGAQIAYGDRSNRDEPASITFGRKLFYLANRWVADSEIVMWMGEFSMFTRQVCAAILAPKTTFISVRTEIGYVGFKRVGIPYLRAKRKFGQTHYNLWRMITYAVLSILSGTTFPLRLVLYLAVFIGVAFPISVWAMQLTAAGTMMAAAITSLYFLVLTIPLVSLYLARVYKNVVHRPVFVVDETRTCL
jgi:glycosyltransferase involved in cell wall biosynthesis